MGCIFWGPRLQSVLGKYDGNFCNYVSSLGTGGVKWHWNGNQDLWFKGYIKSWESPAEIDFFLVREFPVVAKEFTLYSYRNNKGSYHHLGIKKNLYAVQKEFINICFYCFSSLNNLYLGKLLFVVLKVHTIG